MTTLQNCMMRSTNAKHDPATLFLSIYPTVCTLYPHLKGMLREALFVCTWNWTFTVAQTVKNLPAMQETWVQSLGREDPWRRKWQPTPVILPGESHGQRSLVGYSPRGLYGVGHDWVTNSTTTTTIWNWKEAQVSINSRIHQSIVVFPACGILHSTENELPPTT